MRYSLAGLVHLACTCHLVIGAAVFNWPDPLIDNIDDQLYRPFFSPVSTFALGCGQRDNTSIAAEWLRIAYHDMATHDIDSGTGGLDASIAYELDRPQNIGVGMRGTLEDFLVSPIEHVGMADVLAMGAISAVIGCGGPAIPFRAGRIDATEAGPETVPEPQQDLASHIESFRRQGFSATEMISLVACGHSLGGVRKADFPLIVTEDEPTDVKTFASTVGFDNTVVKEYLDGSTQNVLVMGSNVTTRSDLRIFSSDNNATMQNLASPDSFNQICGDLIERMINTVPSTVTLTEPIEPLDFKVTDTFLFPQGGSLAFLATLRIIDSALNRTVTLFWKERTGKFCPDAGCSSGSFQVDSEAASLLATLKGVNTFKFYRFNAAIDLATSISHFWFEVNNNDGSTPLIVDNQGKNFVIDQDVLLFDPRRTSATIGGLIMVAAVKNPFSTAAVSAFTTIKGTTAVPVIGSVTTNFELDSSHPPADGYTFYTSPTSFLHLNRLSDTLHATVDGEAYSVWVPTVVGTGV
ncbi:heme peroxidase [Mycena albidolilacea]|uniref:Peroxidase n=1 Tax=Mycena albidolilacea TaxID=1033008 RepID=A0AAD6Z1V2_9AGAR|nr:heme peroxidase [Mycena albidolilacea]